MTNKAVYKINNYIFQYIGKFQKSVADFSRISRTLLFIDMKHILRNGNPKWLSLDNFLSDVVPLVVG